MSKNKSYLGLAAVVAALAAAVTFMVLYFTSLDIATILFIGLGIASSAAAIVSINGENIGSVVGFVTLLLMMFVVGPYLLPERSVFIFVTNATTIVVEPQLIPLILLCVIALAVVVASIGGNVYRFALWLITIALTMSWFVYQDAIARILISALIAIIVFSPIEDLAKTSVSRKMLFTAIPIAAVYDKAVVIDLSSVNIYFAYLLPLLTFIALDPTNRINKTYRGLTGLVVLFVVFIQILSFVISL